METNKRDTFNPFTPKSDQLQFGIERVKNVIKHGFAFPFFS